MRLEFDRIPRLFTAVVNSLYSFWWDVSNDWGLNLLRSRSSVAQGDGVLPTPRALLFPSLHSGSSSPMSPGQFGIYQKKSSPSILRSRLLFPLPSYPIIVFLNLILRMTWSIKLSSHLYSHAEGSEVIFWLEIAELLRRWLWVFVRVEWEVVRGETRKRGVTDEELELLSTSRQSPEPDHLE